MNSYELIELFGVGIIVCFQLLVFFRTNMRIAVYRGIFPADMQFGIIRPEITAEAQVVHPKELMTHLDRYIVGDGETGIKVDLIQRRGGGNFVTDKIVYSLNTYLLRNKGVASDFHLIKDVVERNCDSVGEDINQTISLPLYLGLLGTFVGIVVGLVQISLIKFGGENSAGMDLAISALLTGVMIAMVASFFGLLLTVLNSGFFFKVAKAKMEDKRNDFYTFIQTDLLPLLNQNINSTLYSLQTNLHKFNEDFKGNVAMLNGVMGRNYEALIAQDRILNTLDNMDISAFGKANVIILQELNVSIGKLVQFNDYLGHLNDLVYNTKSVSSNLNAMMERSEQFSVLGEKIVTMFSENQRLVEFLQNHYNMLDRSHQMITQAVNGVGNTLEESLQKLSLFTQERINEIQKITLREMDLLQNQYPEKWKRLDSLTFLETMNSSLKDMRVSSMLQGERLDKDIRELNSSFVKAITELEQIRAINYNRWGNRLTVFLRGLRLRRKKVKA
jgi:hypothetical protein